VAPTLRPEPELVELAPDKLVGRGLCRAHDRGQTFLVSGALPGERVRARVTERRSKVILAQVEEVVGSPHPARCNAMCPHAPACGGCDWPHVEPRAGASLKALVAAESTGGHRELAAALAQAQVTPSPPAYRLRARLHWQPRDSLLGFYGHRSREVTAIQSCRLLSPALLHTLPRLNAALRDRCPIAADVEWLESLDGSEAVVALRPAGSSASGLDRAMIPQAGELGSPIRGFHIVLPSGEIEAGWGAQAVTMDLPRPLGVPVGAFFQGNRHLAPVFFERARAIIGETPTPTWDLHAGVGFLAAAASLASPRRLTLAETYRPAADLARRNLPEAEVACGCSAEQLLNQDAPRPASALVMTDPPRAGLSRTLLDQIGAWHPQRVLAVSCDPATWARDVAFLLDRGYQLTHLELLDLFPHTHHVEILAMLETP
jgi:tRNA/tmRNA/rRNA uracil-C5-methylase (TrmA/RlmC/RlmD family)